VIGFSPQQVNAMSLWQFTAAADGYRRSITGESDAVEAPSDERFRAFLAGKV
jgi:hypothetical protein